MRAVERRPAPWVRTALAGLLADAAATSARRCKEGNSMRKIIEYTLVSLDGVFEDPRTGGL